MKAKKPFINENLIIKYCNPDGKMWVANVGLANYSSGDHFVGIDILFKSKATMLKWCKASFPGVSVYQDVPIG